MNIADLEQSRTRRVVKKSTVQPSFSADELDWYSCDVMLGFAFFGFAVAVCMSTVQSPSLCTTGKGKGCRLCQIQQTVGQRQHHLFLTPRYLRLAPLLGEDGPCESLTLFCERESDICSTIDCRCNSSCCWCCFDVVRNLAS